MDAELWATIRRLSQVEKLSKRTIAGKLGIHRDTVDRALSSAGGPPISARRGRPRGSKLEPYADHLKERLKEYPELSSVKLLEEIKRLGYGGGLSILKEYLKKFRPSRTQEVFLRVQTSPGEFAQVDWANCGSIAIGNAVRKLSCFVMVLSWSRMIYLEFCLSQSLEDFIRCHINAFKFFQGIPKKCLYDNLKAVCLYRQGPLIRFNSRFMEFAGTFGFEPVLCNPGRGNEKGRVENGIKYIRSSFLAGRAITLWPKLQSEADDWRDHVANVRIHGATREQPLARWESEGPCLMSVPDKDFDCSVVQPAKANSQGVVRFDGNGYTVPSAWGHRKLTVKATADQVHIFHDAKLLAAHPRSYERGLVIEDPKHEAGLLAIKKQAMAAKTKDRFLALGSLAEEYLAGLIQAELNVPHHIAKIMECAHLYGKEETLQALGRSLHFKAYGAPYVKNIILQQRAARGMDSPQEISITAKPEWARITLEEPDLALYDDLFIPEEEPPL